MEPNAGPSVTSSHDPYGFILNPAPKPKKTILGGDSFIKKIALIVGGAVVLMIIVALFINLIFGGKTSTDDIVSFVQTETELIRVADKGSTADDQLTKNVAVNAKLSFTTQRAEWANFLNKYGVVVDPKTMVLKNDPKTDARLKSAQANSTFDLALQQILQGQIETYMTQLKAAYSHTSNTEERTMLNKHYAQAELLLKQLPKR